MYRRVVQVLSRRRLHLLSRQKTDLILQEEVIKHSEPNLLNLTSWTFRRPRQELRGGTGQGDCMSARLGAVDLIAFCSAPPLSRRQLSWMLYIFFIFIHSQHVTKWSFFRNIRHNRCYWSWSCRYWNHPKAWFYLLAQWHSSFHSFKAVFAACL